VITFLASLLGLPKSSLTLLSGQKNRIKQVGIRGLSEDDIVHKILPA